MLTYSKNGKITFPIQKTVSQEICTNTKKVIDFQYWEYITIKEYIPHATKNWWENHITPTEEKIANCEHVFGKGGVLDTLERDRKQARIDKCKKWELLVKQANITRYYKTYVDSEDFARFRKDWEKMAKYKRYGNKSEYLQWIELEHPFDFVLENPDLFKLSENEMFNWLYSGKLEYLAEKAMNTEYSASISVIDRLTRSIIRSIKKYGKCYQFCQIIENSNYKDCEYDECVQIVARKLAEMYRQGLVIAFEDSNCQTKLLFKVDSQITDSDVKEYTHYFDLYGELSNYASKKARLTAKEHYVANFVPNYDEDEEITDCFLNFMKESESLRYAQSYVVKFGAKDEFDQEISDIIRFYHSRKPNLVKAFKLWLIHKTTGMTQKELSEKYNISQSRISRAGKIWVIELSKEFHSNYRDIG